MKSIFNLHIKLTSMLMRNYGFKMLIFFFQIGLFFFGEKVYSQNVDPALYNMLHWRMIGPYRGGRTVGAVGVPQQPNVFYIGVNNGGVWKTTDFGRTWKSIFDDQSTGSVGDIAVAPSNPDVIYAGSGEGLQRPDLSVGNGIYKSTDAGKTWINTGLKDAQQIGSIAIDPKDENKVFVAALGHPYGPNTERGIYRTLNGGKTWEKVLYKDENTGAIQVAIDPKNSNNVFADLWAGRQGPWENGSWQGPESGLFKSIDGGTTWKKITAGLPSFSDGLGRIGFCIAASNPQRMYACVDATKGGGVYKSDDGGESWNQENIDQRLWDRGSDFAECKVDPKNQDIVYIANVVTWKSEDAGKTWKAFRGAPGGDDYHRLWFNPDHPEIILLCSDQGAEISVNGGQSWSSWYNQPTAQFYHVSTDNAFPYNVYGGQQESGSVGIASRGNDGQITFREWHPVGVEEYGYIAADPLDPNIIYGGKITRYNKLTGQVQNISPEAIRRGGKYRFVRTAPVIFSPLNPKLLFFAGNVLFKTTTGGNSWDVISPDLTRTSWDVPPSVGVYNTGNILKTMPQRGVIYTIAPSNKNLNTIWAGTDDGLIQLTNDAGKTWKNITPPDIVSWNKISMIDAGHSDDITAYAAVNKIRLDDMQPYIYKTHDAGKTWKKIVTGLPNDPVNTIREDPFCKGLLFAGTETAVYVSFNDGDNWQPLRLNMPASSMRDLVIKDNDLVVATHGRSFWILDGINCLRDLTKVPSADARLFSTASAWRVRWNMNTDTPLPQEEPGGENPPDGAAIDYYLNKNEDAALLEIQDEQGKTIRTFSSKDKPYEVPPVNIPLYWIRPQQILSASKGAHRMVWDLHSQPLDVPVSYAIAAIYAQTAPNPTSPWVLPGKYIVKLIVDGKTYSQTLLVKMDPRVSTPPAELQRQFLLSNKCYDALQNLLQATIKLQHVQMQLEKITASASSPLADSVKNFNNIISMLLSGNRNSSAESFKSSSNRLMGLMNLLQESDMPVTTQAAAGVAEAEKNYEGLLLRYKLLQEQMQQLNEQLVHANLEKINL